jgi:hypothetical protein
MVGLPGKRYKMNFSFWKRWPGRYKYVGSYHWENTKPCVLGKDITPKEKSS